MKSKGIHSAIHNFDASPHPMCLGHIYTQQAVDFFQAHGFHITAHIVNCASMNY